MTARWRTVLRMRALLRLLLDGHVPLGAMTRCVEQVKGISDEQLPNEQRTHVYAAAGELARDLLHELLGDDVELIDRDTRPPGEPRDLLRVSDELRRRIIGMKRKADAGDEAAAIVHDELVDVLGFVLPLRGAPLPDVERFDEWLAQRPFYDLMQVYRHAPLVPPSAAVEAFEAVKAALREAVRA